MNALHHIYLGICLRSPFIMAGVEASGIGIDTSMLRDEEGRAVLPGDHVKGLLREAFRALEAVNKQLISFDIDRLLGRKSNAELKEPKQSGDNPFAPERGCLLLRDLFADIPAGARKERDITRIAIEEETGTVKSGFLQVVELAAPLGTDVMFRGTSLFYGTDDEAKHLNLILQKALKLIPYFGGLRTVGFGQHIASALEIYVKKASAPPEYSGPFAFSATGVFDRAFLIAAQREAQNVYVGSSVIPGGAIKGAIADMLDRMGSNPREGKLAEVLAAIRIRHARALDETGLETDRPLPLSIKRAPADEDHFDDALGQSDDAGLMKVDGRWACVDFQPDWKAPFFEAARRLAQRPGSNLKSLARGHTAIDPKSGTAQDKDLFLEVLRGAMAKDRKVEFRFAIDAEEANRIDANLTKSVLTAVTTQVDAIGKSHASFQVTERTERKPAAALGGSQWRILLETPAPLLDPDGDPKTAFKSVRETLEAYFAAVLPGVTLVDHFCQRKLIGGYSSRRRRLYDRYRPLTLFTEGSCFLIKANAGAEDEVRKRLHALQQSGLPHCVSRDGIIVEITDWKSSAYVPQNGYGEISINAAVFDLLSQSGKGNLA
jgi:hypothetical protein